MATVELITRISGVTGYFVPFFSQMGLSATELIPEQLPFGHIRIEKGHGSPDLATRMSEPPAPPHIRQHPGIHYPKYPS
ncbi:hypothetical protein L6164_011939 [Bauhinia variegata]|uniref:Uncharacterized protein n=1 Tax=Bauhinia variegata TaxID=167791 RepID=A0ACB9P8G6_BAUVA|nr:hypothetical protein L6164_011939 [Bauhinia variegata]